MITNKVNLNDTGKDKGMVLLKAQDYATPIVRAILRRYPDDVQDVLQQAALNAIRFADKFGGRSAFNTWFTQIAKNLARMHLRRYRGQTDRETSLEGLFQAKGDEAVTWDVPDTRPSPLELANFAQRAFLLHAELAQAPYLMRQEATLILAGNEPGTDNLRKSRKYRLKLYLRKRLNERGIRR